MWAQPPIIMKASKYRIYNARKTLGPTRSADSEPATRYLANITA